MTRDPQALRPPFNRYVELNLGPLLIRYPDGSTRLVATRKIRDTAGVGFYVFDSTTPLS